MPLPPKVTKYKNGNVEFISSVDRVNYTLRELTRAALLEVGKYIAIKCNKEARKLRGFTKKANRRVGSKLSKAAFQFWVRKQETDLLVGVKHDTWYGAAQELGGMTSGGIGSGKKGVSGVKGALPQIRKQPKRGILRNTTYENIDKIREIEGKYLSAIEDENRALGLIDENLEGPDDKT